MTDYENMKRGTSREWTAARIVLIGGFIIAFAVVGYILGHRHQQELAAKQQAVTTANAKIGLVVCAMELASAKSMGIVPPFGQLTTITPEPTGQRGRYACTAATQSLKYIISADLMCSRVDQPKCVKIVSIKTDDGTTLYTAPAK